jgi:hypothetical protein
MTIAELCDHFIQRELTNDSLICYPHRHRSILR